MTRYTWEDFPLLDDAPVVEREYAGQRVVRLGGLRRLELPDNGYQLLLAWLAGPSHVCRVVDRGPHLTTTTVRGGQASVERRTEGDWLVVDEMINGYLHEMGVPPRPRGFVWYLDLPEGLRPADVWGRVRVRTAEPDDLRAAMLELLEHMYP